MAVRGLTAAARIAAGESIGVFYPKNERAIIFGSAQKPGADAHLFTLH